MSLTLRRLLSHRALVAALLGATIAGACAARTLGAPARLRVWAFTVPWDARSSALAREHAVQLDAVISGWIQLDSLTGTPFAEFRDTLARARPSGMRLMAIVTNAVAGRFHAAGLPGLAADSMTLARAAGDIARRLTSGGYRGAVIDLEGFVAADRDVAAAAVRAIADSAHRHGVSPIAVAVPAVDT